MSKLKSTDQVSIDEQRVALERVENMLKKYTTAFPVHKPTKINPKDEVVLLTGTTGSFGSQILAMLLKDPTISRVYALNRKDSRGARTLQSRQLDAFQTHGLDAKLVDSPKAIFVEGDTTLPNFGISAAKFNEMHESVTSIIHNAWPVSFNIPLRHMEAQVAQTRSLVDFALKSPHATPPRFVFVSSESVFKNWDSARPAPEQPIRDPAIPLGSGYCEAKWIAETLLLRTVEQTPLCSTIVRVGQLSGSPNGAWNDTEWVPLLVRTCQLLGCFPRVYGNAAWIPTDIAAAALVELRHTDKQVVHIVHPRPACKSTLVAYCASILGLPVVPYPAWMTMLKDSAEMHINASVTTSARRMMRVFDTFPNVLPLSGTAVSMSRYPQLSSEAALGEAPSLGDAPPLGRSDVENWLRYWQRTGFLARGEGKL